MKLSKRARSALIWYVSICLLCGLLGMALVSGQPKNQPDLEAETVQVVYILNRPFLRYRMGPVIHLIRLDSVGAVVLREDGDRHTVYGAGYKLENIVPYGKVVEAVHASESPSQESETTNNPDSPLPIDEE